MLVDHALAAGVVAELGRVGDRIAHAGKTVLPHQIDDQLQLVQALVVRDLRRVAGLDERLETCADEFGGTAAEDGLLAEEVGFGLLFERRLEDAGASGADADGVRESELPGPTRGVLLDGDQRGRSVPLREEPPHDVARPFRGDHDHVVALGGRDALVEDVEAVGEQHRCSRSEVRLDVLLEYLRLHLIRQQDRDELGAGDGLGDRADRQARRLGLTPRGRALAQAHLDLDARITEVERMGVALAPVADDRNLAVEQTEVAVAQNRRHPCSSLRRCQNVSWSVDRR